MPTYSANIPQASDNPSQSQSQLLQNFQVLNTAFEQDHSAYNSPTEGQHIQITFPVGPLSGQPFTYLSGQIGLQSLNTTPTSRPDIWLSRGTATAYPMTGYSINGSGTAGWSYLPSGCLMAWGTYTISAGGTVSITYASAATSGGCGTNFPGFATMGNPQLTRYKAAPSIPLSDFVFLSAYSNTGFTVYSSAGSNSVTFLWSAIGI